MRIRVGTVALGLLLVSMTSYPAVDARTPIAEARIDAPSGGAQVEGVVEIRGRATVRDGGRFSFYRILIGEGRTPAALRPIGVPYDRAVENGLLATWDTDRFPSGEYLLMLHVYAADDAYVSASTVVTVKYKPTPTPLSIRLPAVDDVPTPVAVSTRDLVPVPNEPSPALNVGIAPIEASAPVAPELAPIPTIASAGAIVPIQPIPLDPSFPGPFPVDTPTVWSSGQLPGDPAPNYLTPINFDLPMN